MVQPTNEVIRQNLSATELLVLLNPSVEAKEALKVGLKELLALGLVRLEKRLRRGWLGKEVPHPFLHISSGERPNNRVLDGLLGDLRSASRHSPELGHVLKELQKEHGQNYERFKQRIILPGLLAQGLLEPQTKKVLGLFRATHYGLTASGLEYKKRLEHHMALARRTRLFKDDPTHVAVLMVSLGPALLMPELELHLRQLNHRVRPEGGGDSVVFPTWDGHDEDRPFEADFKTLDQAFGDVYSGADASEGADGGGE
ncbi:GPP34 family phosphoprotein [Meiothermus sp.]|uniref:GPP34 family phosphoprotein n=1 Tax=Meiothermus sp. TaxID=1955249 RepID=UPI0021DC1C6E|nr:GPP34 family phosphoprotein [Meiothermus sp.]GIW34981.1 MAG: hypothetical protein KatS3mg072_2314 [Meiothermus sp.]